MPSFTQMSLDVSAAARRWLAQWPEVQTVLAPPAFPVTETSWDLWLFQDRLQARVEGTGGTACVLRQAGPWTSPNQHNTLRFPRLLVELWADPDRDDAGAVTEYQTAKDRIYAAHAALDAYLHDPGAPARWWPDDEQGPLNGLRVVKCVRLDELELFPVPDGDGMQRSETYYAMQIG